MVYQKWSQLSTVGLKSFGTEKKPWLAGADSMGALWFPTKLTSKTEYSVDIVQSAPCNISHMFEYNFIKQDQTWETRFYLEGWKTEKSNAQYLLLADSPRRFKLKAQ